MAKWESMAVAVDIASDSASEARCGPCKPCSPVSVLPGFAHLLPVPRYETFRSEKFFRILEGEKAKTDWIKGLFQVHPISSFKDSSPV